MDPARRLAAAFRAALDREGLPADPASNLLRLGAPAGASDDEPPAELAGPDDLGPLHEQLTGDVEQTRRGAWYTPTWVAEALVARALDGLDPTGERPVVDPACGGGVFLLATARHLAARGRRPDEVVACLWGVDVDPLAAAVTEATLWWWSARRGTPTRPTVVVGDALGDVALPAATAVVGNPPFRGQLRAATAVDDGERRRHQDRFGAAVGAYTDPAWLFLLAAVETTVPGGRAVLVQPQSVLGSRDAAAVRHAVDALASVEDCWIPDGPVFASAVDVCAPVLRVDAGAGAGRAWTAWLADALGVPDVPRPSTPPLADDVALRAGFRDEFYGLVGHVTEGGAGARVVTAGDIDPWRLRAGRGTRLGGRTFVDARVEIDEVDGRAGAWVRHQCGPKVLVATQTRVLEVLADPDGSLVASVPVLVVTPHDADRVWHVAAVLSAPVVSAWLLRASAGTALSRAACRPTTALLGALPRPVDDRAWDDAAVLVRELHRGQPEETVHAFAVAAATMYRLDPQTAATVAAWWQARRPRR